MGASNIQPVAKQAAKQIAKQIVGQALDQVKAIAEAIRARGGRALIVGGYVRDHYLNSTSKDIDVEIFGLSITELEDVLRGYGHVETVGRSFGVLLLHGLGVDFSLPRTDNKVASGHRGFVVKTDPSLNFADAARRRDLTINSMGLDILTGELLDPHGGLKDLKKGVLRATDPAHFSEDPLRGLRVAQFAARFQMEPDKELLRLSAALDLSELPAERIYGELQKLLLKGVKPSLGFEFLRSIKQIDIFPEIAAMIDVQQNPKWHPEGCVWTHTMMVLDVAATLRQKAKDPLTYMLAVLAHDFGKATATYHDGKTFRSPRHAEEGLPLVASFLERLKAPKQLVPQLQCLVQHHLAPMKFPEGGAKAGAYRRLARQLTDAKVDWKLLLLVARADHLGRTAESALRGEVKHEAPFIEQMTEALAGETVRQPLVQGRDLIARGLQPGPAFAALLEKCQLLQDESGLTDGTQILDQVFSRASIK